MPQKKSSRATKITLSYYKKGKKLFLLKTKKIRKTYSKDPNSKQKLVVGVFMFLVGLVLLNNFLSIQKNKTNTSTGQSIQFSDNSSGNLSKEPIKISKDLLNEKNVSEPPVRIIVPKRDISVSVNEAEIVNGYWKVFDKVASHGMGSAYPGHSGNTVIFAHAREGLFYNLKNVSIGDEVLVFTKNRWYSYNVSEIKSVYPSQTEVIAQTKDQRLTLYTCDGFADEKRLIVVAVPSK